MARTNPGRNWEKIRKAGLFCLLAMPIAKAEAQMTYAGDVPPIGEAGEIPVQYNPGSQNATGLDRLQREVTQANPDLPPAAVAKAFAYIKEHPVSNRSYVAIADFDRPSDEHRLFIIRMSDGQVERFLVAHGSGSGGRYATRFSNAGESHESSLGVYITGEEYEGKHGRSLKLRGMEATNSAAEARSVVLHGAAYVEEGRGTIGRSWGCPAVSFQDLNHIVNELHGGAILLIYHSPQ